MATLHVTGPVQIYVGSADYLSHSSGYGGYLERFRTGSAMPAGGIRYLGSGERPPRIVVNPRFKPIMADVAGDDVPMDLMFNGEDGQITAILNRWNELVYAWVAARPVQNGTRGTYTANDLGTLMLHEGRAYTVWLHFPYSASKNYGATYSMPAGYRFLACVPEMPEEIQGGATASKRLVNWRALPVYKPSDGTYKLYDHDMTNIPAIPPAGRTGELV